MTIKCVTFSPIRLISCTSLTPLDTVIIGGPVTIKNVVYVMLNIKGIWIKINSVYHSAQSSKLYIHSNSELNLTQLIMTSNNYIFPDLTLILVK